MLAVALAAICAALPVAEAAAARSFGSRVLKRPLKGADVKTLQQLLTAYGLTTAIDGHFGHHTALRVRSWERNNGRRINGRANRREQLALQAAVARGERVPGAAPSPAAAPVAPATAPQAAAPGVKATIGPDGRAVAPASAPPAVHAIIAAGNQIHAHPYKYGGGHGRWADSGYDCSGSMSFAFHGADMLDRALDSSGFMRWGQSGPGQWVTTYANAGHAYMVVAGLRFDTSGLAQDGSRWHTSMRSGAGYTVRHPTGL